MSVLNIGIRYSRILRVLKINLIESPTIVRITAKFAVLRLVITSPTTRPLSLAAVAAHPKRDSLNEGKSTVKVVNLYASACETDAGPE